jgi:hypothetical protein
MLASWTVGFLSNTWDKTLKTGGFFVSLKTYHVIHHPSKVKHVKFPLKLLQNFKHSDWAA